MKRITLTRKGFREWLEGKPGKEEIGWTGHQGMCPIANYLRVCGAINPCVGTFYFRIIDDVRTHEIPRWAHQFISAADERGMRRITARQALAVLDGE